MLPPNQAPPPAPPPDEAAQARRVAVFVSYAHADIAAVRRIVARLVHAGLDVWWDSHIAGGEPFAERIERAIAAADVVLVAWSRTSVQSHWVRDEAGLGRDRGRLVPVTLDGTPPPLGFGQLHALDFTGGMRERSDAERALLAAIERVAGAQGIATAAPTGRVTRRRWLVGAGVGAAALVAAGVGGWLMRRGGPAPSANTVAVLPFRAFDADARQAWFSQGIADEVRTALAGSAQLRVLAEASCARVRQRQLDAVAMADALGVAFLLDGSVRRQGDAVRVEAELIDGATGFSRWAQSFDRRLVDIFAVQREIALAVAAAVHTAIGGAAAPPPVPPGETRDLRAYEAYLRGRALYARVQGETSDRAALAEFDAAIAADARFALAHAARAQSLSVIAQSYVRGDAIRQTFAAALVSAQRAIALAPTLADAHAVLGQVLFEGLLDVRGARSAYLRARSLGGGSAVILGRYAYFAARCPGLPDALGAAARACALDPLNPVMFATLGRARYFARDYAAAIDAFGHALKLEPEAAQAHAEIGFARYMQGRWRAARSEYEHEPSENTRRIGLAITAWKLGMHDDARAQLRSLELARGDDALYERALVHAQFGETARALECLERAFARRDPGLIDVAVEPLLDPLRADARLTGLLRRMGFD